MPKATRPKPTTKSTTERTAATMPRRIEAARYVELTRDVQQLSDRAERVTDQAKVEAFWQLGARIASEQLDDTHGYRGAVLRDLAFDTGIAIRSLQYAVAFHDAYKRLPTFPLSWGHYRLLLDRPGPESRAHYQALAIEQALPVHKLAHQIALDARADKGGDPVPRPTGFAYLYRAQVERIVDGDTLDLRIDMGLHIGVSNRFRLAAIDTPELQRKANTRIARRTVATPKATRATKTASADANAARAARDFVFDRLANAKTIVVKTERSDNHGRFVTHLFYSDEDVSVETCFLQGHYLNAELFTEGHATLMT